MKERLVTAIADINEEEAMRLVRFMLDAGEDAQMILDSVGQVMSDG